MRTLASPGCRSRTSVRVRCRRGPSGCAHRCAGAGSRSALGVAHEVEQLVDARQAGRQCDDGRSTQAIDGGRDGGGAIPQARVGHGRDRSIAAGIEIIGRHAWGVPCAHDRRSWPRRSVGLALVGSGASGRAGRRAERGRRHGRHGRRAESRGRLVAGNSSSTVQVRCPPGRRIHLMDIGRRHPARRSHPGGPAINSRSVRARAHGGSGAHGPGRSPNRSGGRRRRVICPGHPSTMAADLTITPEPRALTAGGCGHISHDDIPQRECPTDDRAGRLRGIRWRRPCDVADLGRFAEPSLYILVSLADGPKHGYAIMADVEAVAGTRDGPRHPVRGARPAGGARPHRGTHPRSGGGRTG